MDNYKNLTGIHAYHSGVGILHVYIYIYAYILIFIYVLFSVNNVRYVAFISATGNWSIL